MRWMYDKQPVIKYVQNTNIIFERALLRFAQEEPKLQMQATQLRLARIVFCLTLSCFEVERIVKIIVTTKGLVQKLDKTAKWD